MWVDFFFFWMTFALKYVALKARVMYQYNLKPWQCLHHQVTGQPPEGKGPVFELRSTGTQTFQGLPQYPLISYLSIELQEKSMKITKFKCVYPHIFAQR